MLPLERNEARHMPAETQRVYVYGIIRLEERGEGSSVPPMEGLAGSSVRTVASDGLAAIVSVLATAADGAPFEEELKDPGRAKRLILDHHRVLRRAIGDRTVLPVRFGALFADDMGVAEALDDHHRDLVDALDRVEGAREWGVKIFCDHAVLSRRLGEESPAVHAAQNELSGAAEGHAFFLRRRIARLGEEEARRVIAQHVEAIRQSLEGAARADASMKLQPAAVHGRADEMVWNGALLVARPSEQRFFALVEELRQIHEPRGFAFEITGPWPPFSFADCRLGG